MTAMPATRLGLADRGRLAEGYKADVAVFDRENIGDQATRQQTNLFSTGMEHVFVNGKMALKGGNISGYLAGEVLKNAGKG